MIGVNDFSLQIVNILMIAFLAFIFNSQNKAKLAINKVYMALMVVGLISSLVGAIFGYNAVVSHLSTFALSIVAAINIFIISFINVLFTMCVYMYAKIDFKNDKGWLLYMLVPYICQVIINIMAIFSREIFSFDANGNLVHGGLFAAVYLVNYIYVILWFVISFRFSNILGEKGSLFIRLYATLFAATPIIQVLTGLGSMKVFTTILILIIEVYDVRNPDEVFDSTDSMYREYLMESVASDYISGKHFKLLFVKIMNFGALISTFGQENTSLLLKGITKFLNSLDKSAVVYRFQKDVICVKFADIDDGKLDSIIKVIENRFLEGWRNDDVYATFPIAQVYINAPEDLKTLRDFTDFSMLMDYSEFKDGDLLDYETFKKKDNSAEILNAVRYATANKTFKVYYQPIYSTDKKKIIAAEALVRLFDDKLGFVSPEVFIPLAEREGFILDIGRFVFEEVCRFMSNNNLQKLGIEYIEVNLSAIQCMQYKLAEEFIGIMNENGLTGAQINFEITESSAMITNSAVSVNINNFVNHGVDLSLDDYGTGYSNLSYLYRVPFSFVKVDKSLLWSSDKNERAYTTLESIFRMAKKLKMRVVVEGVETEEHIRKLLELGCDYFQGYYFSKPVPGDVFLDYLEKFSLPEVCK